MKKNRQQKRSGFSMVELLVVMAIIAILAAMATVLVGNSLAQAKKRATEANLKKISEMLKARINGFDRWLGDLGTNNVLSMAGVAATSNPQRDLVTARKILFRTHFPQLFSEMTTPLTPGGSHTPDTESAECLYNFLFKGELFGTDPITSDDFLPNEIGDTDGDGLLEMIDSWNHPLRFYRWPTRLIKPDGMSVDVTNALRLIAKLPPSADLARDPDDPLGLVPTLDEATFHTANTFHTPLVVSAGPDGILGLYEPNDKATNYTPNESDAEYGRLAKVRNAAPTSPMDLEDNLTNLNINP